MKTRLLLPLLLLLTPLSLRAESVRNYQVTGSIVALTDNVITVQKGDEKFEIARTATTKGEGKLAVGTRVTVYYKMSADSIEVKEPSKASSTDKADKAAEKAERKAKK